jgi:hypothetical protein
MLASSYHLFSGRFFYKFKLKRQRHAILAYSILGAQELTLSFADLRQSCWDTAPGTKIDALPAPIAVFW